MDKLKKLLDAKVEKYNRKEFIGNDPVSFPHAFSDRKDIEVAALLASVIAWGNRRMILRSGHKMLFDIMQGRPYDFVMQADLQKLDAAANIHRTFFVRDLVYLCRGLRQIYLEHETLERLFEHRTVWDGIASLRNSLACANGSAFTRHISSPEAVSGRPASACKRLHMMLRWLCRRDGIVDLGIWNNIPPSDLMIPLDVHVARTGRALGLVQRKQNDRRTVEELTSHLREFSPDDPVKYDFALFGVGVDGDTIEL